jgi:hypothetical protein
MGDERILYRVLVGKTRGKRPLGRPRHRWEDAIIMALKESAGVLMWMKFAQDRDRRRTLLNIVMNLRVLAPKTRS